MPNADGATERQTKNARRAEAREKARQLREEQRKKEKRNTLLMQGGIGLGVVAVIAIVAVLILNSTQPAAPGPRNMASDGITVGADYIAVTTPGLAPEATPRPLPENEPGIVAVNIWVDYLCPACGAFEAANADTLRFLIESGSATVTFHPIAILSNQGASQRAANAAACVADRAPNSFFDFNELLLTSQPGDGTGWSDEQLVDYAASVGAGSSAVAECITSGEFSSWVTAATNRALAGPLPLEGTDLASIQGTPTVLVNGDQFLPANIADPTEFQQFVLQAAGEDFTLNPTPEPEEGADDGGEGEGDE
ncbi:DsbA family protein [Microcella sp.]|uniref:DsbA family protein n=1 Tax=Microcella sp. TaxID=1913979 RepID=UPI00391DB272